MEVEWKWRDLFFCVLLLRCRGFDVTGGLHIQSAFGLMQKECGRW